MVTTYTRIHTDVPTTENFNVTEFQQNFLYDLSKS